MEADEQIVASPMITRSPDLSGTKVPWKGMPDSPIQGVAPLAWAKFRLTMEDSANTNRESESGHFGIYRFSLPRLCELGFVANCKRSENRKWSGGWIPPLTPEGFLSSVRAQNEIFGISCANFFLDVRDAVPTLIDRRIDNIPTTLSGLLAVAHRAGFRGLQSWLARADDRKRFPNTTAAFRAANGVF